VWYSGEREEWIGCSLKGKKNGSEFADSQPKGEGQCGRARSFVRAVGPEREEKVKREIITAWKRRRENQRAATSADM